jgi:hypothetical protein
MVQQAEDRTWTEHERARNAPTGYPRNLAGIYFYWEDTLDGAVLRYLGKTLGRCNGFQDRHRNAGWFRISRYHPYVAGMPSQGDYAEQFKVRWIDIIALSPHQHALISPLEVFLLGAVRTTHNVQGVPAKLLREPPIVIPSSMHK